MIHLPVVALGSIITSDARRAARCARESAERGSRSSDSRQAAIGAIAQRIGPKLQLTAGPLIAAAGLLLTLRIGSGASYVTVVLPAVTLFGLGLAMFVAPLTAAVLAATPPEHVGVASAVNNAVARSAGLLGVALLPAIAGLSGDDYQKLNAFAAGYRLATLVDVALLVVGAVLVAIAIGNELPQAATKPDGVSGAGADALLQLPGRGPTAGKHSADTARHLNT
jgi:MFS family permease